MLCDLRSTTVLAVGGGAFPSPRDILDMIVPKGNFSTSAIFLEESASR